MKIPPPPSAPPPVEEARSPAPETIQTSNTRSTAKLPSFSPDDHAPTPKQWVGVYTLWLFGGFFGLHRFYLHRWFSGLLYAFSFGFFGVGWLLDAFFLPRMLRRRLEQQAQHHPKTVLPLPQWAQDKKPGFFGAIEWLASGVFFLFAPALAMMVAVFFRQWLLLLLIPIILLLTNFVQMFLGQPVDSNQWQRMPIVKEVMHYFITFLEYYRYNQPRSFFYYLFFPLFAPIALIRSAQVRQEFKLYWNFFSIVLTALVLGLWGRYQDLYYPYVNVSKVFFMMLAEVILLSIVFSICVVPLYPTAFKLSLRGSQRSLRLFTFGALLFAFPLVGASIWLNVESPSFAATSALQDKLKHPQFRAQLHEHVQMFFMYYAPKMLTPPKIKITSKAAKTSTATTSPQTPQPHPAMQQAFARITSGWLRRYQSKLLVILRFQDQKGRTWFTLNNKAKSGGELVYVIDDKGHIYDSQKTLPLTLLTQLTKHQRTGQRSKAAFYQWHGLIADRPSRSTTPTPLRQPAPRPTQGAAPSP